MRSQSQIRIKFKIAYIFVWAIKFVSALSLLPTELVSIPNADFNSSASVKMALKDL
jgi:hypothetical protein